MSEFRGTSWRHHLVQTLLREGDEAEAFTQAVRLGDALVEADRIAADGRGRDLADRLLATHAELKVLFISGYADEAISQLGELAGGVSFLEKPFTPEQMNQAINGLFRRPCASAAE